MPGEKKWYAILVREQQEKKIIKLFSKRNIEFYYPTCPFINKSLKKRNQLIKQALFPSTIFVHIPESRIPEIAKTKNIISFYHWQNTPAVISNEDIFAMVEFLGLYETVWLEKSQLEVLADEKKETIFQNHHEGKIKVCLPTLGYALIAQINNKHRVIPAQKDIQAFPKYSFQPG